MNTQGKVSPHPPTPPRTNPNKNRRISILGQSLPSRLAPSSQASQHRHMDQAWLRTHVGNPTRKSSGVSALPPSTLQRASETHVGQGEQTQGNLTPVLPIWSRLKGA